MISPILEQASRRAQAADVVVKTDETITLAFENGRLKSTSFSQEQGINLRVVAEGRMGFAGTTSEDVSALLEAAFASARLGEEVLLPLPFPAPLPAVRTHYPHAAAAKLEDLQALGRAVLERLDRKGCQVNAAVERSVGSVRVANSRGVDASYDVSAVSISVELIRVDGDDVLIISDYLGGADLPELAEVEALVMGIQRRVDWAARRVPASSGSLPVCFTPAGSPPLLLPLQIACLGKSLLQGISPLGGTLGVERFSSGFSLTDEPLLDGRNGSRPVDDEGVVSRPLKLVERGVVRGFVYDLETAGRGGVSPTGHGRRSTFGKPQAAYSNLVVAPGTASFEQLLQLLDEGLLVDELLGVGQGNVIGGAFSHPVALAYRVSKGEIVGRVTDAAVAGNAYELLNRIVAIGHDAKWSGSTCVPPMVIDGVAVTGR